MPRYAVAIVLGSLLAFYGNELPDSSWSAYAPLLLLWSFFLPRYRFLLLAAAAYLWSCALFHFQLEHRLVDAFDNRISLVEGDVRGIPELDSGRTRFYLENVDIAAYPGAMPRLLRLSWYQDEIVPQPGERWRFVVKLRQPRGLSNPGGFDFEAWQFTHGIDAGGYVRNSPLNVKLRGAGRLDADYWRMRLALAIDRFCADCSHRGLIKALTLGFRGDIANHHKRLLQSSGTAHLLAISGLHIGMVSLFAFALGRYCWRFGIQCSALNRLQAATLLAMLAATTYAALAGFSLPTVRALVMLLILSLALLFKSRINLLQSLSMAVIVILLTDPRAVGSSSFWLSLCALLVIAFAQFRLGTGLRWWQHLLALQAYFSLLFAPLGLLVFDQLNPAGFIANIIAIPLVSFIVLPLLLLACVLVIPGLGVARVPLTVADQLLQWLLAWLDIILRSGLNSVDAWYPAAMLMMAMAMLAWLLLPRLPVMRALAVVTLAMLVYWQPARLDHGEFELVVLDVGMGTSILVRTRHHSLVYDFGPGKPGIYSAAEWALLPLMNRLALRVPDLAVISHVDQDHSGGLPALLERYPGLRMLSGTPRELEARLSLKHGVPSCHDYPAWRWDGIDFRFFPPGDATASSNNRSCVLLVDGVHRVLIPGDIESGRERSLLAGHAQEVAADVLIAPHHGSNTSSSPEFLERVAARHAVFTVSRGNRWGFPAAPVVTRYSALGIRQFRSDRDGAITIFSTPRGLEIKTRRLPPRRIWRRW
ncbi:MAG: DNA internalization-related competence protein ComEC/Rec2 [Gammaproteobacteria bacterium]|nr:DNA internalization-related competence protein ComEC/Rec2 [Gammaproteobacteria bacterium]